MKKVYILENLDCANCAAKIEGKFNALPEVEEAVITFATKQLRLTAEDPDALVEKLQAIAREVEHEVVILPRQQAHHHHEGCSCGHEHHHHEGCACGHEHHHEDCHCGHDHGHEEQKPGQLPEILLGAGLFVLGLILEWLVGGWWGKGVFLGAYLVLGGRILVTAGKNLIRGHVFDENFLMSIATLGALIINEFPEAVGVMLFYRVGEYFEEKAVEKSRKQIMDAVDLRPEVVNLLHGDEMRIIPAGEAQVGDLLLVRPGDRIPLDGVVVSGESRIDTAPITGEPVPVGVKPGDPVISGCVNTSGQLTVRVEKPLSESMVTRILDCVENAAASKPKIDRFITRFARIYTPVVVCLAVGIAIIPSLITGNWRDWVYTALSFLVMSCPCALVLSVPLAFFAGIGVASRQGILFKGGAAMEALAKIRAVVMDKTGTVTRGDFSVRRVVGGDDLLALCASCESRSTHPIARSIVAAAEAAGLEISAPQQVEELPGLGIRAVVDGKTVLCGNRKLMEQFSVELPVLEESYAGVQVLMAVDGQYSLLLEIDDTLKDGAAQAIDRLKAVGIGTAMLTGDREESAAEVARQLGIEEVHARLLPQEKLEKLHAIRHRRGSVMFVGDGFNDAPVLSGADVGAAMGSGADAAIEAADVVFLNSDVAGIPESIRIARQTWRVAWQNVVFALTLKLAVMVLGLWGVASMWMAVFADSGVAMLCVINSIRMLYRRKGKNCK